MLVLAGCSSGPSTPGGPTTAAPSPSSAGTPPAGTQSAGTPSAGTPSKVYTDQELMAIINAVAQNRQSQGWAQDSQRMRSVAAGGSIPGAETVTTPGDCAVFASQNPFAKWADKSVSMADGMMPVAGMRESGPTTTIILTLQSAEAPAIAQADFNYTVELAARCSQFDLASTESGMTSTYAVQLLSAPDAGEKRFAWLQTTKPQGPGDFGWVGLRVLAGTMSVNLGLSVAAAGSEADVRPALDSMAALAQELIDQAAQHPPSVAAAPPNSRTPDDVVALLKGVAGPTGKTVDMPAASVIGSERPGIDLGQPSQGPRPPCSFSGAAYQSPIGSVVGQGQIQGASKMDFIELAVISMPTTATPPHPFDTQAAALRDCPMMQEDLGEGTRQWSAIKHLTMAVTGDSSYAVAYQLADGTGQWHVLLGARKGTLAVEASTIRSSEADAQPAADVLGGVIGQVFAKAGL
ncbi:hypothetical protein ASPU41_04090 [Arthrobacter sp. U41]|nr:hypothetical protein ASPU41_04090 [Arthrobacter sp. U41]